MSNLKKIGHITKIDALRKSAIIKLVNSIFSIQKSILEVDNITDLGLIMDTSNIIPEVLKKRTNKNSELVPYPLKK